MKLQIISNKNICGNVFRMRTERGGMDEAVPGQFIHVRCSSSRDPLLRRPFSIASMDEESVEIIYRTVGTGTRLLSEAAPGSFLDAIGPLGTGFPTAAAGPEPLLAAGGMGVAPLLFLAAKLSGRVKAFIHGAGTSEELVCASELADLGILTIHATDDGTCGIKGSACSAMEEFLAREEVSAVFGCGPRGMLMDVCRIAAARRVPCHVSLENRMACGLGACLGCAVKITEGGRQVYRRVCRDGPVFPGEAILWEDQTFP